MKLYHLLFVLVVTPQWALANGFFDGLQPLDQLDFGRTQQPAQQQRATQPTDVPYGIDRQTMNQLDARGMNTTAQQVARYDRFYARHCTTQRDGSIREDASCGRVSINGGGDPNFHPERLPRGSRASTYMNIPRNSQVTVVTSCAEDGRFYTRMYYTDANGQRRPFDPPWKNSSVDRAGQCITSPGVYNRPPEQAVRSRDEYRTRLPRMPSTIRPTSLTAWHVVSDAKEEFGYAGAVMPWAVWLNGSGYAYHAGTGAGNPPDGYPASAGCFRLSEECAKSLFYLMRRVGTRNVQIGWGGYNHPRTGQPCTRPANARPPANLPTQAGSREATTRARFSLRNWWRRITGRQVPQRIREEATPTTREVEAER